jgi:tRNA A37 threonylcarbamoyladenosine biosynthesis protein TsaE
LESKKDAVELGFLDFLADKNSINLIEWADRIEEILPENTLEIHLKYLDQNRREYRVENIEL